MRLRNIKGSRDVIAESEYVVHEPEKNKGIWADHFNRKAPLHIEIGMGKGQFITTLAKFHPDINYIGIEKYSSVLLRGLEKENELLLPNLCFIRMDAEEIENVFDKGEVDRIYLNFSDPWPKDRHAKRRLTSRQFLLRYDAILAPAGRIEFKTDNVPLFDFSVEEAQASGWDISELTRDLHHSEWNEGNVMTEYEERFSAKGNNICRMVLMRKTSATKQP